jgi:hypothetical protein
VKKGTPLYGQPSWWGEDDADDYKYPHKASMKGKSPGMFMLYNRCQKSNSNNFKFDFTQSLSEE